MRKLDSLNIWKKALDICENVYKATDSFPENEKFGLTSQIRRAVVSISSNIAEGAGRNGTKEFIQFLSIANGSTYEVQTQLLIAKRLNYISEIDCNQLVKGLEEIQKMNFGLQSHLSKTKI